MKRYTATPRRRRSREEIAELLEEYQRSELTQQAFADEKGISLSCLSLWLRNARERAGEGQAPDDSSRLVPVRIRSSAAATEFELVVRGGAKLRIPTDFDEEALRRLLGVLDRC
jgi:transposase-like protein